MSPVAVGAEEKRVTRCRVRVCVRDPAGEAAGKSRDAVEAGTRRAGGQSEGGRKEKTEREGGAIGMVVCAGTEKGGWSEHRRIGREERTRGEGERESRHADPPEAHRAIPGAALNESAFLCPAMLSKCKQRSIIYHPLRKQPPALPS